MILSYAVGDSLYVTYKPQQPTIEKYGLNNISRAIQYDLSSERNSGFQFINFYSHDTEFSL